MNADDVSATRDIAPAASGCDSIAVLHKPRLLADNGPCTIAATWPNTSRKMAWIMSVAPPTTPKTQGKIERWHQTLRNRSSGI